MKKKLFYSLAVLLIFASTFAGTLQCEKPPRPKAPVIAYDGCPPDSWWFTPETDLDGGEHKTFFTDGTNSGWIGHAQDFVHSYGKPIAKVKYRLLGDGWKISKTYWFDQACHVAPNCPECGDPIREMPYAEDDLTAETYADGTPVLMIAKLSHEPCEVCGNAVDGFEKNEWNKLSNTSIVAVYTEPFMGQLNWRIDNGNQAINVESVEVVTPEGTWYVIMDDRVNKDSIEDIRWLDMEGNSITLQEDGEYVVNKFDPCSLWPGPWLTWNPETGQHEFEYGYYANSDLAVVMVENGYAADYNEAIEYIEAQEFVVGPSAFPGQ